MKKAVPSEMPAAVPNWHSKAGGGEKNSLWKNVEGRLKGEKELKAYLCSRKYLGTPRSTTLCLLFRDLSCDLQFKMQTSVTCCPWIFWAVREAGQGFQDRTGVSIERKAPYHCSSGGHLPTAIPGSPHPLPWG